MATRRKSEAKSEKNETRTVGKNDNKKPVTGERLMQHVATVKGYKAKIESLNGHLKQAFKVMKAEGIQPAVIREIIAIEKADPIDQREYYEQLGIGIKATGQPFQLNIFDAIYETPVLQAQAEGRQAGLSGRGPENKWAEGSPEAEAFMDAYHEAQASLVPGAQNLSDEERDGAVERGRTLADA